MGCEVILVRHGETEWNRENVFRGRIDVPLNDKGRGQAAMAARVLAASGLKAVYSSPLSRAIETARALAEPVGLEVIPAEELTDAYFGAWEGLSLEEVERKFPVIMATWRGNPDRVNFPQGGEGLNSVGDRTARFLQKIGSDHPDDVVVVVSHRVPLKAMILKATGCPLSRFWNLRIDMASISRLEGPHRWVLTSLNDTHHLSDSPLRADF